MIKAIIFDLDGVLVDTKDIHFQALNTALKINNLKTISYSNHIKRYDGFSTDQKLKILLKDKKNKNKLVKQIKNEKNRITKFLLNKEIKYNKKIYNIFEKLSKKYTICVATNAINNTLKLCLRKLKISKFIKYSLSNEDVKNKKPHPEIYLKILIKLGMRPKEVLILEDSYFGRKSVQEAGCNLMPIKSLSDVSSKNISYYLKKFDKNKTISNQIWTDDKLNILIPMAGAGSRFKKAGYTFPKPLIEVNGSPMIEKVVKSLQIKANYIFIINDDHQKKYNIRSLLQTMQPNCKIITVKKITKGAACTTLLSKKYIDNDNPLLIVNSDQIIKWNSSKTMYEFIYKNVDGGILVFKSIHPKWSYAKLKKNNVIEVAEKKVISNNATVGVYFWKKGKDYVSCAEKMIKNNIKTNNEFYVCPVYNEAIKEGKKIIVSKVKKMYGLGTPEDLVNFKNNYAKV